MLPWLVCVCVCFNAFLSLLVALLAVEDPSRAGVLPPRTSWDSRSGEDLLRATRCAG